MSWPIINSAAMNIGMHMSFQITVLKFLDIGAGMRILDHTVTPVFKRNCILFSIVDASIFISTNTVRGFPFIHALFSIYCL